MAFDVTPTSGQPPFVFTADFSARYGLDAGYYFLQFYINTEVGFCPNGDPLGTTHPANALALLETGIYTQSAGPIPSGSCRTSTLVIREVGTNNIVSQAIANIDNV